MVQRSSHDLLHKTVTLATTSIFLLQLGELKFSKRKEDCSEVFLGDGKVDVSDIEPVKWDSVRLGWGAVGDACLSVLFGLGQLHNDRNTEELLACKAHGSLDRFFVFELYVSDTVG